MGRIALAFRAFFGTLFNGETAAKVERAFGGETETKPDPAPTPKSPAAPPKPKRSEAITLLATLQREARLIDFVKEPLDGLGNEQIGAAVRDIHRNLAAALERLFELKPVLTEAEGASVTVPRGFDAGRYHLVGNVAGDAPFQGTLAHHGWEASKCELPAWSGDDASQRIVAAAEVEIS